MRPRLGDLSLLRKWDQVTLRHLPQVMAIAKNWLVGTHSSCLCPGPGQGGAGKSLWLCALRSSSAQPWPLPTCLPAPVGPTRQVPCSSALSCAGARPPQDSQGPCPCEWGNWLWKGVRQRVTHQAGTGTCCFWAASGPPWQDLGPIPALGVLRLTEHPLSQAQPQRPTSQARFLGPTGKAQPPAEAWWLSRSLS